MVTDLANYRALAATARDDTSDGLTAREPLPGRRTVAPGLEFGGHLLAVNRTDAREDEW
jgi:hypothetical protein